MKKYFQRGRFNNNFTLGRLNFFWSKTSSMLINNAVEYKTFNVRAFVKVLVMRGIGYRSFVTLNDLHSISLLHHDFLMQQRPVYTVENGELTSAEELSKTAKFEFINQGYLVLRAGHTNDLHLPLNSVTKAVTSKKNRKLTLISNVSSIATNIAKRLWAYRQPSVYTGRGVRIKHVKPIKKAGKKDKQKGKAF